jgi:hypothetical protein
MVLTKTAVIYSNSSQECDRMAQLLKKIEGVEDFHRYELGKDFEDYQFRNEFGNEATYPQCAIGMTHIGDMKTTLRYMSDKGMFV